MSGFGDPVTAIWGNTTIGNRAASYGYTPASTGDDNFGSVSEKTKAANAKSDKQLFERRELKADLGKIKSVFNEPRVMEPELGGGKRRRTRKARKSRKARKARRTRRR